MSRVSRGRPGVEDPAQVVCAARLERLHAMRDLRRASCIGRSVARRAAACGFFFAHLAGEATIGQDAMSAAWARGG
jgi:hypothetical protein